jgi:hypothetical protein
MNDMILVAVLVLAFATAVTAHVTLGFGLARIAPRWHALVAFVVPPLAPLWGLRARPRMIVRSVAWIVGVVVYVIARSLATR